MILLDTNVVSEALRPSPEMRVVHWLDEQDAGTLHLSAVSLAELLVGIAYLPAGRRRKRLASRLSDAVTALFEDRLLSFDAAAAEAFASLMARAREEGTPVSFADGQIAAIAAARGFDVATRDRRPFEACGIRVIDPWT